MIEIIFGKAEEEGEESVSKEELRKGGHGSNGSGRIEFRASRFHVPCGARGTQAGFQAFQSLVLTKSLRISQTRQQKGKLDLLVEKAVQDGIRRADFLTINHINKLAKLEAVEGKNHFQADRVQLTKVCNCRNKISCHQSTYSRLCVGSEG